MLGVGQAVERLGGQLTQAAQDAAVGRADDVAVDDVHIGDRAAGDLLGVFEDLVLENLAGLRDGEADDVGLTGGIGAEAERGHVGILTGDDVHIAVVLDADDVGRHLRVGRIGALTDLRLADLKLDRAVLIEHHAAGGMLQRDRPDGGVIPEGGNADALADVAGLVGIFGVLAVVVHVGHSLVEALIEGVKIVLVFGEAVDEADRHQMLAAELQRVDAERLADVLDVRLVREGRLRHTVAAHGAGGGAVGIDGVGVALEVVAGIELRERAHRLGDDAVTVGGVSALIGEQLGLAGDEGAVRAEPRDEVEANGVADAVGDEGILAGNVQLHQTAAELHRHPSDQRLIERVLLVAEAAADVRLDDAHAAPVDAQRLTDGAADDVRDLGGGDDDDLAGLFIGIGNVVFNVAVLDGGRLVPLVHANQPRLLDGFFIVALADLRVLEDVVGEALVDLRRAVLHGLLYVEHEGQLVVFDLDQTRGLRGGDLVLRDHDGDVVTVIAHMDVQQTAVGDVLMRSLD